MSRYTIPGKDNDRARARTSRDDLTWGEAWRIILAGDRLHGIGVSKHPRPVHVERVRRGAWEGSPRVYVSDEARSARTGWTMPNGTRLENVHPRWRCGSWCVIHNPMPTHMDSWPLHWRDDRGIFERICRHGVGHPAPEQEAHLGESGMVHGCCGCCAPPSTPKPCACCQIPWAIPDSHTRAGMGAGEGTACSGPENTYKCAHCGLDLRSFETAWIGDAPVCHPHEGRDCYRRVTVFGEILGSMKDREGL